MIEKTLLYTSSNETENITNLYNFLLENAVPEYFDSVTKSGNTVTCGINDKTFANFKMDLDGGYIRTFFYSYYINGSSYFTDNFAVGSASYFYQAIKCKHGIFISVLAGSNYYVPWFAITKDNEGNTVTVSGKYSNTNALSEQKEIRAISTKTPNENGNIYVPSTTLSNLTALTPVVVMGTENYCPNAFVLPYAQNRSENVFAIDGVKYYSNGIWCIKDE